MDEQEITTSTSHSIQVLKIAFVEKNVFLTNLLKQSFKKIKVINGLKGIYIDFEISVFNNVDDIIYQNNYTPDYIFIDFQESNFFQIERYCEVSGKKLRKKYFTEKIVVLWLNENEVVKQRILENGVLAIFLKDSDLVSNLNRFVSKQLHLSSSHAVIANKIYFHYK